MSVKEEALNALMLRAATDRAEAMTSLNLLLNHPCGVGEHSTKDFHDNLNEALDKLENADGRIQTLKKYFGNFLPHQGLLFRD
jgi:hypothetical protein